MKSQAKNFNKCLFVIALQFTELAMSEEWDPIDNVITIKARCSDMESILVYTILLKKVIFNLISLC